MAAPTGENLLSYIANAIDRIIWATHCAPHRLQLTFKGSFATIPYLVSIDDTLHKLHHHLVHSTRAHGNLAFWAAAAGDSTFITDLQFAKDTFKFLLSWELCIAVHGRQNLLFERRLNACAVPKPWKILLWVCHLRSMHLMLKACAPCGPRARTTLSSKLHTKMVTQSASCSPRHRWEMQTTSHAFSSACRISAPNA